MATETTTSGYSYPVRQEPAITAEESYTTETGETVTLVRYHDPAAREPFPADYWTWRWSNGWVQGLGWLHNYHLTREDAIARLEATERIKRLAGDYSPLTREEYEDRCHVAQVEVLPDREIALSYGIRYGQFTLPAYDADTIISMHLARRRQIALEDEERIARDRQAPSPEPMKTCGHCGQETPELLWSNSTGGVCPDCYTAVDRDQWDAM